MKSFLRLSVVCLCLSGCALGRVVDCTIPPYPANCFVGDGHYEKKTTRKHFAERHKVYAEKYKAKIIEMPSKTWGDQ